MPKSVKLVRHGESLTNVGQFPKGQKDPGLTEKGHRQAAQLRGDYDVAIVSRLRRAQETCASATELRCRQIIVTDLCMEQRFSEWDMPFDDNSTCIEESTLDVSHRVFQLRRVLHELLQNYNSIVVFTHACFICIWTTRLCVANCEEIDVSADFQYSPLPLLELNQGQSLALKQYMDLIYQARNHTEEAQKLLCWNLALDSIPSRLEAYHDLMMYYYQRKQGQHRNNVLLAYAYGAMAANMGYREQRRYATQICFPNEEVMYLWLFDMEFAFIAFETGHHAQATQAAEATLQYSYHSPAMQSYLETNLLCLLQPDVPSAIGPSVEQRLQSPEQRA